MSGVRCLAWLVMLLHCETATGCDGFLWPTTLGSMFFLCSQNLEHVLASLIDLTSQRWNAPSGFLWVAVRLVSHGGVPPLA